MAKEPHQKAAKRVLKHKNIVFKALANIFNVPPEAAGLGLG